MRLQDRPTFRASATARFSDVRRRRRRRARRRADRACIPRTAGCSIRSRRSSPAPTTRGDTLLLLAFESADHPLDAWIAPRRRVRARPRRRASTTTRSSIRSDEATGAREGAAGSWRNAFVRAPYTRDALVGARRDQRDVRDRVHVGRGSPRCTTTVTTAVLDTAEAAGAWPAVVTCRFTHVYPDGPRRTSPCSRSGTEPRAARAVGGDQGRGRRRAHPQHGGTITHHHAVGRDHRRWYDRQRPEPFAAALRAAKRAVDPAGILNPGVLIDPHDAAAIEAVIFDLGGVVFPSPFEAFDAYDHGTGLAHGHRARAHPTQQRDRRVGRARAGRADDGRVLRARSRPKPTAAGFALDAAQAHGA